MIGAGIGFLWYNTYPAQVFMGDVGALALGGGLGMLRRLHEERAPLASCSAASSSSRPLSVITQVISFKLTGKRIFLMAPIHHHYEKKGWAEPKIIVRFWIISILLALGVPLLDEAAVTQMNVATQKKVVVVGLGESGVRPRASRFVRGAVVVANDSNAHRERSLREALALVANRGCATFVPGRPTRRSFKGRSRRGLARRPAVADPRASCARVG